MKISQNQYKNTTKPPVQSPAPPPPVVNVTPPQVIVNTDDKAVSESIDRLSKTLEKKINGQTNHINPKGNEEIIKHIGSKMDKLVEALNKKPSSFEFDIVRSPNGKIDKVLVKPIK